MIVLNKNINMCCNSNNNLPIGPIGPTGATGATGPQGATGSSSPSILYNTRTSNTTVDGAGLTSLVSYTVIANQMKTNDDLLEINSDFIVTANTNGSINIYMGGTILNTFALNYIVGSVVGYVKMTVRISRVSATTVYCDFMIQGYDNNHVLTTIGYGGSNVTARTVNNLTSLTNLLDIQALSVGGTITTKQFIVKYFNK